MPGISALLKGIAGCIAASLIMTLNAQAPASAGQEPKLVEKLSAAEEIASCPELLSDGSGGKITKPDAWTSSRRAEILELFRQHVYGRAPIGRPDSLKIEQVDASEAMDGKALRRQFDISWKGQGGEGRMRLLVFIPKDAPLPVPVFLLICNRGKSNIDPERKTRSEFWPAEEIVARGYAAAAFFNGDIAADKKDSFSGGVFQAFDPAEGRKPDSWGAIAAWAWGASRAMDCLEGIKEIDKSKIAVAGHSRGGKTALCCAAQDQRFAMAISNDSGSTGAALARGKTGERIAEINRVFPYWFCDNYKKFNDAESSLPVDQHMLLALIAPRLLYVASATDDATADPSSEFRSCVMASPAFALFGLKGVEAEKMPPPESPLHGGAIGYHLRTGKHDLTLYDWSCFMDFASSHGWRGAAK